MEGDFIAAYGADGKWHLWRGATGGGAIRKATTVAGELGTVLVPPATWEKIPFDGVPAGCEGWGLEPEWSSRTAYLIAWRLSQELFGDQLPAQAVGEQAHSSWWLGVGGRVKVITEEMARGFIQSAAERGQWGQLELVLPRGDEQEGS